MGLLCDYYRARDDDDAMRVRTHLGGPMQRGRDGSPPFDGVEAKGIDDAVVLGQLLAMIRGVAWTPGLSGSRLVAVARHDEGDEGEDDEDDGELDARSDDPEALDEGPWVIALPDAVRDDLAGIDPARMPELAARWARIDELHGIDGPSIQPVLEELCALARRARAAGEHLYHWVCV